MGKIDGLVKATMPVDREVSKVKRIVFDGIRVVESCFGADSRPIRKSFVGGSPAGLSKMNCSTKLVSKSVRSYASALNKKSQFAFLLFVGSIEGSRGVHISSV